jgi:hypothetical protein
MLNNIVKQQSNLVYISKIDNLDLNVLSLIKALEIVNKLYQIVIVCKSSMQYKKVWYNTSQAQGKPKCLFFNQLKGKQNGYNARHHRNRRNWSF